MPLTRRQQIAVKREVAEGQKDGGFTGANALLVFDPQISDALSRNERVPASPSIGRTSDTLGRSARQFTCTMDFNGTTDVTVPIAGAPSWGQMVEASGLLEYDVKRYALTSVTGTYQIGEKVYLSGSEDSEYGLALDNLTGDGNLLIVWLKGAAGTGTLVGKSSGASGTAGASAAVNHGFAYVPTSNKRLNVTTGAWSGGPTLTVGQALAILDSTTLAVKGSCRVDVNNGSFLDMDVSVAHGRLENGDILATAAAETATVSAKPTSIATPSLSIRSNKDGLYRDLLGCRGSFTLSGEAGAPLQFAFTMDGLLDPFHGDSAFLTGGAVSQVLPERLLGAKFHIGVGAVTVELPLRGIEFDSGNSVNMRPDARETSGDHHAELTDRDPSLVVNTDQIPKTAFDALGMRNNGTPVRFGLRYGTGIGRRLVIAAPQCQITEVGDEDGDGVAGFALTLMPRFLDDGVVTEEGDNEFVIAVTS